MTSTLAYLLGLLAISNALLPVQENVIREYDELDGLWDFLVGDLNDLTARSTLRPQFSKLSDFENAMVMPVPSSYNDLDAVNELRNHIGFVYYQKDFYLPEDERDMTFVLRFDSVNYRCKVFLNGNLLGENEGAHLPFEFQIPSGALGFGRKNRLTVAVSNVLTETTIPQGKLVNVTVNNVTTLRQETNFHYFHYAGILRSVYLQKFVDSFYLKEIEFRANETMLEWNLTVSQMNFDTNTYTVNTTLYMPPDEHSPPYEEYGSKMANFVGLYASNVPHKTSLLWWPRGMGEQTLLTLEVQIYRTVEGKRQGQLIDLYRLKVGVRSVEVKDIQIHINGRPFYCVGYGVHEDFELRGRGFDPVVMIKDLNLLEWSGVNCIRTYHPVSEEMMQEFDRRGIAVIVESPAVGIRGYSNELYSLHREMLYRTILRDQSHPSVIMWSLASNPDTSDDKRVKYFKNLTADVRAFSTKYDAVMNTTLFTINYGESSLMETERVEETTLGLDVISVSRFYGWTEDYAHPERIRESINFDIAVIRDIHEKPVLLAGYGAESAVNSVEAEYSQGYHMDVLSKNHDAIDDLRNEKLIAGEIAECLADYLPKYNSPRNNTGFRGVFTRAREAKGAAYLIRERYHRIVSQPLGVDPIEEPISA